MYLCCTKTYNLLVLWISLFFLLEVSQVVGLYVNQTYIKTTNIKITLKVMSHGPVPDIKLDILNMRKLEVFYLG